MWDSAMSAAKIVDTINHCGKVTIDFDNEAPDIHTTELEPVLNYLHSIGIEKHQVEIITGNLVESYNKFNVIKRPASMYELPTFQRMADQVDKNKHIQKHFGCFVGRSNINRLLLAGHLKANYADKTLMTYHFSPGVDFHRVHLGLEDILYHFGANSVEFDEAIALIKQSPIKNDQTQYVYPIDNNHNANICDWYKNIFVDIVCETFSNGNVFFLTEKFWRPIVTKTPFILQGSQFTLKRLKQLGFQTFDRWWDEGYDEDPYLHSQKEIKKVLEYLGNLDLDQINQMYNDMQETLTHNYNCMMNLTYKDFACVK